MADVRILTVVEGSEVRASVQINVDRETEKDIKKFLLDKERDSIKVAGTNGEWIAYPDGLHYSYKKHCNINDWRKCRKEIMAESKKFINDLSNLLLMKVPQNLPEGEEIIKIKQPPYKIGII